MKVVHLETQVITNFGVMDDDGDIIHNIQVKTDGKDSLLIRKLTPELFSKALEGVLNLREQLQTKLDLESKNTQDK